MMLNLNVRFSQDIKFKFSHKLPSNCVHAVFRKAACISAPKVLQFILIATLQTLNVCTMSNASPLNNYRFFALGQSC